MGDGTTAGTGCVDMDECALGVSDCLDAMLFGSCTNTDGAFSCGCAPGYIGDGTMAGTGCADFDECTALTDNCVAQAGGGLCSNSMGSFACACVPGFTGDGTVDGTGCADVDECALGTSGCLDAMASGTCTNTVGSFMCGCDPGYTGDGTTSGSGCADVDECLNGLDDCLDPMLNGTCANTAGSFFCGCTVGFDGDGTLTGTGCADVDECTIGASDCVDAASGGQCTNNTGSFSCACTPGFTGDGTTGGTGCADVDECGTGANDCLSGAQQGTCTNTAGSFTCGCAVGFQGDGTASGTGCTDVDECATGASDCDAYALCQNTVGSYACRGFYGASPFQNKFWRLENLPVAPATTAGWAALSTQSFKVTAQTVTGCTGLATDPANGDLYAILKLSGVTGRVLARVDPSTGVATQVGSLGGNFSSLAFRADGTLFGTTGNAGANPESLFIIDKNTATPTLVVAMGNGADGEIIQFGPDADTVFHWSGNGTVVFESFSTVSPVTYTVTGIPLSGAAVGGETFGAWWDADAGAFTVFNISSRVMSVTPAGVVSGPFGTLPDDLRTPGYGVALPHRVDPAVGATMGGDAVTLRGSGFLELGAAGAMVAVDVGGNAATGTVVDDNQITLTTPAGTAGPATVSISASPNIYTWPAGFTYQ